VIAQRREKIKASTYDHEYNSEIKWKANLDSWPSNTEMEIGTLVTKEKEQKRIIDQNRDT